MVDPLPPPLARPGATRIGWIGLGVMGAAMCRHLLEAGYEVTVHTRTRAKAGAVLAAGASWADNAADVARRSDVTFVIVGYPAEVREVVLGPAGVLAAVDPDHVVVDMTTSDPALAVEIATAARSRGCHAVDAPVSGGDVGAREARLSIMVGGDHHAVAAVRPCLEVLGATVVHQGGPGAGQHTKLVNQTLVAAGMIGVCEALLYAYAAGLDVERVLTSVSSGAASSWALANLAPRMVRGDFEPGFYVEHFVKDLGLALAEARRMGIDLPGLALAERLYTGVLDQGRGRLGTQALVLALAELSGVSWPAAPDPPA